ncbi:LysM peptidoglycan-binding domain-containing protein [Paenibacillus sp. N1-5-1-14]|uniref:LysM peptidoglycan-binding domain-containing protein n=1 Tax=Paenibacillus radicibacter TaxID=2972488 RepID=UPI002158E7CC|nr:LysM peptidoglycan-binding domain-containing protein [Paenibacillus radicibacter]MCR8641596.1 LysM peptidoglycan-binding domain-containing protein [Paenibacillus radicibacter]
MNKRANIANPRSVRTTKQSANLNGTLKKHRRLVRVMLLVLLIVVAACGGAIVHTYAAQAGNSVSSSQPDPSIPFHGANDKIIVNPGESLWSIATEFVPKGMTVREYMRKLQQVNGMKHTNLEAGQALIIPTY